MTAATPDPEALAAYLRDHADEPNAWDGHGRADQLDSYRQSMRRAAATLAAVTAERDDARREVEHQKWIKAQNTATLVEQLDQARQMLADAEQKISSMELDASLREEDERFADPL